MEQERKYYLAIDIGASSGRHIVGWSESGELKTEEVYRFPNGVQSQDGHLVWDIEALFQSVKAGIKAAFTRFPKIESLAIDTWGVDYVLLKGDKESLPCYAYRDGRTAEAISAVHKIIPFEDLYKKTGIQFQSFNTVYQLYDDLLRGRLSGVTDFLMLPEYLSYRLTGVKCKEYTEATTTGLVDVNTGEFSKEIIKMLGFPEELFPKLSSPQTVVGRLKSEIAAEVGGHTDVILCASHDTASAVEGIPMTEGAYLSSGTWSLLGVKAERAICSDESRLSNFTNEGGVGYIRYLKNIMGLWIVNQLRAELCPQKSFDEVVQLARESNFDGLIEVDGEQFLAPSSMAAAIDSCFQEKLSAGDRFRCAYRSLATCYAKTIKQLEKLLGRKIERLYVVGGGAKNAYLNELTQKACKIEVVALPIEATAIGNLKLQMERK